MIKALTSPLFVSVVIHAGILISMSQIPAQASSNKKTVVEMAVVEKKPLLPPPEPPKEAEKPPEPEPPPLQKPKKAPKPKPAEVPLPKNETPKEETPPEPPPPPKGFSVDMANTVETGPGPAVAAKEGGGNMFGNPNDKLPPGDKTNVRPPPPPQQGAKDGVGRGVPETFEPPARLGSDKENTPPYPQAAQRAEVQGQVILRMLIGTHGRPEKVQLVKGLGYGCDEIAIQWAKERWRFKPAMRGGKPVEFWITAPVTFVLGD